MSTSREHALCHETRKMQQMPAMGPPRPGRCRKTPTGPISSPELAATSGALPFFDGHRTQHGHELQRPTASSPYS